MSVFYEVAELTNQDEEPFAVIRIDTDKRAGSGVEGVVVSMHWSRRDANAAREFIVSAEQTRRFRVDAIEVPQ